MVERPHELRPRGGDERVGLAFHHEVPGEPVSAPARVDEQVGLVLGEEDHDVGSLAPAAAQGGQQPRLDLGQRDRVSGLHARVVRLLDPRVARVRDDGAPPLELHAIEQIVLGSPVPQQGLELAHPVMFAALR